MIFLLFLTLSFSCSIIKAFESSDDKVVEKYLSDFYNYDSNSNKLGDGVKQLQKLFGLPEDGQVTKELVAHVGKSRCGRGEKETRSKRYHAANTKWDKGVSYRFYIHDGRHPRTMTPGEIRRALTIGLQYWSLVADIYFYQIATTRGALFSLSFVDAEHVIYDVHNNFAESRDPYPMDNVPGGVLAHAYFPRSGNLHLDSAEEWSEYKDDGINLRLVTAHEMGHAIGLHHTEIPEALMYPAYTGYISERDYKMHEDDSNGAIFLYGKKPGMRYARSEKKIRKRSANENELCNTTNINGAFEFTDGNIYVISNDNNVFRVVNRTIDATFTPFKLQENLQNADAIFFDYSSLRLVMFKGDKVYSASGLNLNNLTVSEMKITLRGAFQGTVSAAFARTKSHNSRIQQFWAIEDGEMISGRLEGNRVSFSSRPTPISRILRMSGGGHFPPSIDGAFLMGRRHEFRLVLFIGNSVYVARPSGRKFVTYTIPAEYPKTFKQILKC